MLEQMYGRRENAKFYVHGQHPESVQKDILKMRVTDTRVFFISILCRFYLKQNKLFVLMTYIIRMVVRMHTPGMYFILLFVNILRLLVLLRTKIT